VHRGFWWGNLRKRDLLEDLGIDGRIILKGIFKKWNGMVWNGLIWLRAGTGGRLLWPQ
jgi:hypothetical protein